MKNLNKLFLVFCMSMISLCAVAQEQADKLYLQGQKLQQTMTLSSQDQAIAKFKSAKAIYKVEAKKTMCDNQIATCQSNKKTIKENKPSGSGKNSTIKKKNETSTTVEPGKEEKTKKPKRNVTISVSTDRLDFKYKPKEGATQSVEVSGDCDGWHISEQPEWVTVSVTAGKFYVEAKENTTDSDRSGVIVVTCEDKSVKVVVNQDKPKGLGKILDKIKGNTKK